MKIDKKIVFVIRMKILFIYSFLSLYLFYWSMKFYLDLK